LKNQGTEKNNTIKQQVKREKQSGYNFEIADSSQHPIYLQKESEI